MADVRPSLPPEIEYEIFVTAFYIDAKGRTTLLHVSKRVAEWLLPLLYSVVTISDTFVDSKIPPTITLEKYGHHVRHFFLMTSRSVDTIPSEPLKLLPLCPNVTNLALWFGGTPSDTVLDLPVRRLALDHRGFLELKPNSTDNPHDTRVLQWCSNITHLALAEVFRPWNLPFLNQFPALEYVMIFHNHDQCDFATEAFKRCPHLKIVVRLLGPVSDYEKTQVANNPDVYEDERVVRLDAYFVKDWYRGTQGLGEIWEVAEKEVDRRRGNKSRS